MLTYVNYVNNIMYISSVSYLILLMLCSHFHAKYGLVSTPTEEQLFDNVNISIYFLCCVICQRAEIDIKCIESGDVEVLIGVFSREGGLDPQLYLLAKRQLTIKLGF